jgi:hypothetical protein
MSPVRLDFTNPEAVAGWLAGLRAAFNDLDAVGLDLLCDPSDRELGPALAAQNYHAARDQLLSALDFAGPVSGGPAPTS